MLVTFSVPLLFQPPYYENIIYTGQLSTLKTSEQREIDAVGRISSKMILGREMGSGPWGGTKSGCVWKRDTLNIDMYSNGFQRHVVSLLVSVKRPTQHHKRFIV